MVPCDALGIRCLFTKSRVKIELAALSIAARELITAPSRAAITNPNTPTFWGSMPNSNPNAVSYL